MPLPGVVRYDSFNKGLNNLDRYYDLPQDEMGGFLRDATNVDISRTGNLKRRSGYIRLNTLSDAHSGYSDGKYLYHVDLRGLVRTDPTTLAGTTIDPNINTSQRMDYVSTNYGIYYSNGVDIGKIVDGAAYPAWTNNPSAQPTLSAGGGGQLREGKYQVLITASSRFGEESGAYRASLVDVSENGLITLTNLPADPNYTFINIYLTPHNGDVLYLQASIPNGVDTYYISRWRDGKQLDTQFMETMTPGNLLAFFNGRLYVSEGRHLWFSDYMRPGLYNRMDNYFLLEDDITILGAVEDGLYVVAGEKTYFLKGNTPGDLEHLDKHISRGVKGTGIEVDSQLFRLEFPTTNKAYYWWSDHGAMLGLSGGIILPLTEDKYDSGDWKEGATLLKETEGVRKLISSVTGNGIESKLGFSEEISVEIIKNGN